MRCCRLARLSNFCGFHIFTLRKRTEPIPACQRASRRLNVVPTSMAAAGKGQTRREHKYQSSAYVADHDPRGLMRYLPRLWLIFRLGPARYGEGISLPNRNPFHNWKATKELGEELQETKMEKAGHLASNCQRRSLPKPTKRFG